MKQHRSQRMAGATDVRNTDEHGLSVGRGAPAYTASAAAKSQKAVPYVGKCGSSVPVSLDRSEHLKILRRRQAFGGDYPRHQERVQEQGWWVDEVRYAKDRFGEHGVVLGGAERLVDPPVHHPPQHRRPTVDLP